MKCVLQSTPLEDVLLKLTIFIALCLALIGCKDKPEDKLKGGPHYFLKIDHEEIPPVPDRHVDEETAKRAMRDGFSYVEAHYNNSSRLTKLIRYCEKTPAFNGGPCITIIYAYENGHLKRTEETRFGNDYKAVNIFDEDEDVIRVERWFDSFGTVKRQILRDDKFVDRVRHE